MTTFAQGEILNLRTCLLSETWPQCAPVVDVKMLAIVVRADTAMDGGIPEQAALIMGESSASLAIWERAVDRFYAAKRRTEAPKF